MVKNFTIMDTRKMSKHKLEVALRDYVKQLEGLGMSHVDACDFVSTIMNIGVAIQEKFNLKRIK